MQRLLTEAGTTTVLVTHDQDEALSTADRVAVLRDGRIAQCAAPQELYSRPVDADMARFIGEANLIPGLLNGSSVQTLLGMLPVTHAGSGGGQRTADPGHRADPAGAGGTGARCGPSWTVRWPARVTGYGYHGHDAVVTVLPEAVQAARTRAGR